MRYTYMYSFKCGAIGRNEVDLDWIYIDISFIHSLKPHMPWSITDPLFPHPLLVVNNGRDLLNTFPQKY